MDGFHALPGERPELRLIAAHVVALGRWWNFADVCDRSWRLYLVDAPGAAVIDRGRAIALMPHQPLLIPAHVRFTCRGARGVNILYVQWELPALPGQAPAERIVTLPTAADLNALEAALRDAITRRDATRPYLALALAYRAFAGFVATLPAAAMTAWSERGTGRDPIGGALRFIEDRLAEPLPVARLARVIGLGADRFAQRFRTEVGQTPAAYIRDRRLAVAARLLERTTQDIPAIATACGFADRFHFSRCFAHRMGEPPARWRQRRHAL